MATSKSSKTIQILIEEASDPDTDPKRLRELARYGLLAGAVLRNPSVPEDTWRNRLLERWPEAWDNPMAPIYLIAWTPHQDDPRTLEEAALGATYRLFEDPTRCSTQGKVLLAAKVHEWWETTENPTDMMSLLGHWANAKGDESPEHREVVRILVECVRMAPGLTDKDNEALDLLKRWAEGGEDRIDEAKALYKCHVIDDVIDFARCAEFDPSSVTRGVLMKVAFSRDFFSASGGFRIEDDRKLANLIRREMPFPPVVE